MDDCKNGEATEECYIEVETWKSGLYAHTTVQYCCSRLLLSAFWQLSKLNFHLEKLENDTTEWITNWGSELAEWDRRRWRSLKVVNFSAHCVICHSLSLSLWRFNSYFSKSTSVTFKKSWLEQIDKTQNCLFSNQKLRFKTLDWKVLLMIFYLTKNSIFKLRQSWKWRTKR